MTALATYDEMKRAAEVAAAKVKPRSHLAFEELVQEAWMAVLTCRKHFNPDRGTPFGAYATRAGIYACQRASWRSLRDHARQAVLEAAQDPVEPVEDAGKAFDRRQWRRDVRGAVRRVLAGPGVEPEAVRLILRLDTGPTIAGERGVRPQAVYNESSELRGRLKASPELQRLWRDRP